MSELIQRCMERYWYLYAQGGNWFLWFVLSGRCSIVICVLDLTFALVYDMLLFSSLAPMGLLTAYAFLTSIYGLFCVQYESKRLFQVYNYHKVLCVTFYIATLFMLLFFAEQACKEEQPVLISRTNYKENQKLCIFSRKISILIISFSCLCYYLITFIVSHVYCLNLTNRPFNN